MEDRPNYWGILPAPVRYAAIPDRAKVLYAEIAALTERDGYCSAGNAYFARLYEVDEKTITRNICALSGAGFLRVEVTDGNARRLWLVDPSGRVIRTAEIMQSPRCMTDKNVPPHGQKCPPTDGQKCPPLRSEQVLNKRLNKEGRGAGSRRPAAPDDIVAELRTKAAELQAWAGASAGEDACASFALYFAGYVRAFLDQAAVTGPILAQEFEQADETLEALARRYNNATPRPTIRPTDDTLRWLRGERSPR